MDSSNISYRTALLGFLILTGVFSFTYAASAFLPYEYDLDYSSGFVIEDTNRLLETGELYMEPSIENGFESVKYPPLFYILFGLLGSLTGTSFLLGRLITSFSLVGTVILSGLIINRNSGKKQYLIPLLIFGSFVSIYTGLTIRVDILAILLSLSGIYLALNERYYQSILPFLGAFMVKQTFVAGFIAVSFYMLQRYNWQNDLRKLHEKPNLERLKGLLHEYKDYIKFNLAYFGPLFGMILLLEAATGSFLQNTLLANAAGLALRLNLLSWTHMTFLPIFLLSGYYIYLYRDSLLGTYFIASLTMGLLQLLRGGAWVYPLMEPFVAAVLCVGTLRAIDLPDRPKIEWILILQVAIFLWAPLTSGMIWYTASMPEMNSGSDAKIFVKTLSEERPYTEHAGYSLRAGKTPPPEIWGMYEQYSAGRITEDEIVGFFESRNYTVIMAHKRLFELPVGEYLEENYRLTDTVKRRDTLLHTQEWRIYKWTG